MDFFGLALHLTGGLIGGSFARRFFIRADCDRAGSALAFAIGGLFGGQVVERSMAVGLVALDVGSVDVGAAVVAVCGATVGGAALAALTGFLDQHIEQ